MRVFITIPVLIQQTKMKCIFDDACSPTVYK